MNYVKINGRVWNVRITEMSENFNILDTENAGRVIEAGAMTLDRIGTFYGHKLTFAKDRASVDEFDELFMFLSKPTNSGISVEFAHNQATIKYIAYVSSGERKIQRIDTQNGVVYWNTFSANFIPMKAQVLPT